MVMVTRYSSHGNLSLLGPVYIRWPWRPGTPATARPRSAPLR